MTGETAKRRQSVAKIRKIFGDWIRIDPAGNPTPYHVADSGRSPRLGGDVVGPVCKRGLWPRAAQSTAMQNPSTTRFGVKVNSFFGCRIMAEAAAIFAA